MSDLPERFRKHVSAAGLARMYDKVLALGSKKGGKSRFAAGFPRPFAVVDTGEGGIQYLIKPQPGDEIVTITDPREVADFWRWACEECKKTGRFKTLVMDSATLFWDNTKEWGARRLAEKKGLDPMDVKVEFQDWGWIKKPVNQVLADSMRVPAHVVMTTWVNETAMNSEETRPGEKAKTEVVKQNVADIEKHFPYLFDYMFSFEQGVDGLGQPNGRFQIKFYGGRVPPSVPAGMLVPGRTWKYDGAKPKPPEVVYEEVVGWLREYKEQGGVASYVGIDAEVAEEAVARWNEAVEDEELGKIARVLDGISEKGQWKVKTMGLASLTYGLSDEKKAMVQRMVDEKKVKLGIPL